MRELHLPWLEISILVPLLGALWVSRVRNADEARNWCLLFTGFTFACALGTWFDFSLVGADEVNDRWHPLTTLVGDPVLVLDQLSAPLLSMVALLYFLTTTATLRTKVRRFSFAWTLVSEAITLATFSCKSPWMVIALLSVGTIPPYIELRARGRNTQVYVLHMALFVILMVVGQAFVTWDSGHRIHHLWVIAPLLIAVLIRAGIAPFHCWVADLFEKATFGTALLFVTPLPGAYAAVRLLLPVATDGVLRSMAVLSLATAVYAAGMALVQRDARRFCCYLFLSHSALVLVGLETVKPLGLTGGLCVWLSVGLAVGGFGLTLRALEGRRGRLSMDKFNGLYEHTPNLAMCFVLTGLASVGFPGTFGFVGTELLVDGAVELYPYVGVAVVLAEALNGIAIVQTYFRLFTGTQYASSVSLLIRVRERYAVLALAALILLGGLIPHPWVVSRHRAAEELLEDREVDLGLDTHPAPLLSAEE